VNGSALERRSPNDATSIHRKWMLFKPFLKFDLSQIPGSFVIARNSAFTYKGKAVDARQIGRELGVRYILQGSVQRSANQIRVNAQLIDAETGSHLWAESFDRERGDLFAM
jgi:TolB-like protein